MTTHERFVDNGDVRIRYLSGDPAPAEGPEGLPVVLVPGLSDFADDYAAVFDVWGRRRFVVVEVRGRGGSDAPPTGYSVRHQASDVESVLAAEGLSRFHLMSFSRGTTTAIEVAKSDPSRVASLSIGDYPAIEMALTPEIVERLWRSRFRGLPVSRRMQRHALEGLGADSQGRDLWQDVAGLGVPVLVARGADGGVVVDGVVERYRAEVPGVEIVTIPGAKHDLFRPERGAYPRAVLEMIGRRTTDR